MRAASTASAVMVATRPAEVLNVASACQEPLRGSRTASPATAVPAAFTRPAPPTRSRPSGSSTMVVVLPVQPAVPPSGIQRAVKAAALSLGVGSPQKSAGSTTGGSGGSGSPLSAAVRRGTPLPSRAGWSMTLISSCTKSSANEFIVAEPFAWAAIVIPRVGILFRELVTPENPPLCP